MHAQVTPEDSRLLHSIPPARVALIERIAQATPKSAKAQNSLQQRFVRSYFRGVGEEDLAERTPAVLAKAAMDHLAFGSERRAAGQSSVRVFNPDPQREANPPPLAADEVSEGRPLLEWMEGRHFVFLGYRHYTLERGSSEDKLVPDTRTGLGILRNGNRGTHRSGTATLRGDVRARARE